MSHIIQYYQSWFQNIINSYQYDVLYKEITEFSINLNNEIEKLDPNTKKEILKSIRNSFEDKYNTRTFTPGGRLPIYDSNKLYVKEFEEWINRWEEIIEIDLEIHRTMNGLYEHYSHPYPSDEYLIEPERDIDWEEGNYQQCLDYDYERWEKDLGIMISNKQKKLKEMQTRRVDLIKIHYRETRNQNRLVENIFMLINEKYHVHFSKYDLILSVKYDKGKLDFGEHLFDHEVSFILSELTRIGMNPSYKNVKIINKGRPKKHVDIKESYRKYFNKPDRDLSDEFKKFLKKLKNIIY